MIMGLFLEKKWPRLILAAYLACAIMGMFTFAAVEPFRSADLWEDGITSGVSLIQHDLSADTSIEGEPVITNGRGYSFSPPRNGSPRTVMLPGTRDTGSVIAYPSLQVIEKINRLTVKNSILLKLRI
jgi:hypothetical protein